MLSIITVRIIRILRDSFQELEAKNNIMSKNIIYAEIGEDYSVDVWNLD